MLSNPFGSLETGTRIFFFFFLQLSLLCSFEHSNQSFEYLLFDTINLGKKNTNKHAFVIFLLTKITKFHKEISGTHAKMIFLVIQDGGL